MVGIAQTELDILGGFNYHARRVQQPWEAIVELKKQYEVRGVNLDVPVGEDVAVLIVPQASSLTPTGLRNLHDHIWGGRPTLILEDPMPMFAGPQLASSQPRPSKGPQRMGQAPEKPDPKPDLSPLLTSLGLEIDLERIIWSDFNPSHQFRSLWPRQLVWTMRSKDGIGDIDFLNGVDSLLFPWPGELRMASEPPKELAIARLAGPAEGSGWGRHRFPDFMEENLFGPRMRQPTKHVPSSSARPAIAMEITGHMRRAFDAVPPTAPPSDTPTPVEGALSEKPIHVIVVADTDFAHDEFFAFYRNANNQFSDDAIKFLRELKNVQFISNAVDALSGEKGYLSLRTRRPKPRPLTTLVEVLDDAQMSFRNAETAAQNAAQAKIDKLKVDFEARLAKIEQKDGLDENAKNQLRAQIQRSAQRRLDADTQVIERERDLAIRSANIKRQREVEKVRGRVRTMALGIPCAALAIVAILVWSRRRRDESLTIPSHRQRSPS